MHCPHTVNSLMINIHGVLTVVDFVGWSINELKTPMKYRTLNKNDFREIENHEP